MNNEAENKLKDWLDKNKYSYLPIDQKQENFPLIFGKNTKRPDFLVIINHIGFIAVDVKDKNINSKYGTYTIEETEIQKYLKFESMTRMPVWFVFADKLSCYTIWRATPVLTMLEHSVQESTQEHKEKYGGTHSHFRAIPIADCKTIKYGDNLSQLFV